MDAKLPDIAIAEQLAERIVAVDAAKLPEAARSKYEETLIDVAGLCLAARNEGYVKAAIDGWDEDGPCTAIGHKRALSAAGAAFVNVSRGEVVDQEALVAALQAGRLSGATLDVFETEPLPSDSPLWDMPGVLITPHLASVALPKSAAPQIAANIRAVLAGRALSNEVSRVRGY